MSSYHFLLALAVLGNIVSVVQGEGFDPPNSGSHPLRIWSSSAGTYFNDSYVIGSGRLGATIPGGAPSENIRVNEDSLWSGGEMDRVNPGALSQMPNVQSLLTQQRCVTSSRLERSNWS